MPKALRTAGLNAVSLPTERGWVVSADGGLTMSRMVRGVAERYTLDPASLRSEDAARQEWERIKHKNGDLLGNLSATAIRADLGEKGVYYRIQTGPVADPAAAERI